MPQFLRDRYVRNVTIDENRLTSIHQVLQARAIQFNNTPGLAPQQTLIVTFIIRFDEKGHKIFNFDQLITLFTSARKTERIYMSMENAESRTSNRNNGTYVDVWLDAKNIENCLLRVASDDEAFVDGVFAALSERLESFANRHALVRNQVTVIAIQICGVVIGFVICLAIASKVAIALAVESQFIVAFLFLLLIFSNIWSYLNPALLRLVNRVFPNILFEREGNRGWHWLPRAVVGSAVAGAVIYTLSQLFSIAWRIAGGLFKP